MEMGQVVVASRERSKDGVNFEVVNSPLSMQRNNTLVLGLDIDMFDPISYSPYVSGCQICILNPERKNSLMTFMKI